MILLASFPRRSRGVNTVGRGTKPATRLLAQSTRLEFLDCQATARKIGIHLFWSKAEIKREALPTLRYGYHHQN